MGHQVVRPQREGPHQQGRGECGPTCHRQTWLASCLALLMPHQSQAWLVPGEAVTYK